METEELWGKGWSLRTEQDPRAMTYLGTVTKSGIHFHYYRDDDGEIYFDNEPEGGKIFQKSIREYLCKKTYPFVFRAFFSRKRL